LGYLRCQDKSSRRGQRRRQLTPAKLLVDYQAIKLRITGHGLQVAGVAGEALGAVRRQQEADERRQTAEAEQDASAAVQDARDLPRVGRQAGQVELAAVHTA